MRPSFMIRLSPALAGASAALLCLSGDREGGAALFVLLAIVALVAAVYLFARVAKSPGGWMKAWTDGWIGARTPARPTVPVRRTGRAQRKRQRNSARRRSARRPR